MSSEVIQKYYLLLKMLQLANRVSELLSRVVGLFDNFAFLPFFVEQ